MYIVKRRLKITIVETHEVISLPGLQQFYDSKLRNAHRWSEFIMRSDHILTMEETDQGHFHHLLTTDDRLVGTINHQQIDKHAFPVNKCMVGARNKARHFLRGNYDLFYPRNGHFQPQIWAVRS